MREEKIDSSNLIGESLADTNPELADEWNYEKNGDLLPTYIAADYPIAVWWKCNNGHVWLASPNHRRKNSQCLYCKKEEELKQTCLVITHPEIAAEWHPTLNEDLKPTDVKATSAKRVYWLCKNSHEVFESVANRVRRGECLQCKKDKKIAEKNLEKNYPEIAAEWHPTLNGDLKPSQESFDSSEMRWWVCSKEGHPYEMTVYTKTHGNGECPYCRNKKVLVGFNDLATKYPEIAAEWHPTLNGDLKPTDVVPGTQKEAFWLNEEIGEWKEPVSRRVLMYEKVNNKKDTEKGRPLGEE